MLSFAFQLAVTGYAEMQGGNTLVTNTYDSNNGLLTKSAYGNGYNVLYVYDELNRVSAEKHGSDPNIYYYYDNNGNLSGLKGGQGGIEYKYEYDFIGRLVRSFATKDSANYLTSQIKYDDYNRLSRQKFILADGTNQSYQYFYTTKDSLIGGVALPYSRTLNYTYDSLNRPLTKTITGGTADVSERYTYRNGTGTGKTTHLVSKITYSDDSYLQYGHDALNNIIAVFDETGKSVTYEYDGLGQLIRENNPYSNKTYMYNYDTAGNINAVRTYDYTTGEISGTPDGIATYTYGDTTWKDKLTKYNNIEITYDSIGNPLNYRNGTLAWAGRQLKSYTSTSGVTTIYTYNSDGVRIGKKSVYQGNTSETSYVVSGTQILSETNGSNTIYYIYDDKGLPTGIVYNGVTYTYRKNVQGDIIAILNSAGTEVVNYTYNAWGLIINASGSLVSTLGYANPFRYRGYYYDTETGYYYLNSRYYDPTTGRFLNPEPNVDISGFDSGAGLLGYNVYAYCANNPIMHKDENGEFILSAIIIGAVAGAVIGGISSIAGQAASGQEINWAEVGVSAVSGAITGAISAACPGMGAVATGLVNGAVGAATHAATELVNGRTPTLAGTLVAGVTSGVLAGGTKAVGNLADKGFKIKKIGRLEATNHAGDPQLGIKYQINKPNGRPTIRSFEFHYNHSHQGFKPHWQQNSWNPWNDSVSSMKHWTWWGKRIYEKRTL